MSQINSLIQVPIPMANFKYNTVKILSIQQSDNKIKIVKMVRRKLPIKKNHQIEIGAINLDCSDDDENKENIIEIPDSDEEIADKMKIVVVNQERKIQEKLTNQLKTDQNPNVNCQQKQLKIMNNSSMVKKQLMINKFEVKPKIRRSLRKINENPQQLQIKQIQQEENSEVLPKLAQTDEECKSQEIDCIQQQKRRRIEEKSKIEINDSHQTIASDEVQNNEISSKNDDLKIPDESSLNGSSNNVEQFTKSNDGERNNKKSNFLENIQLEPPENDTNNNLTQEEKERGVVKIPGDLFAKLKCHRGCYSSRTHQKKHRTEISSPLGLILTKRDQVDESYKKDSLKKMEDLCKAPKLDKFDQFIHATRDGKISKTPRGRFGRKVEPSEILISMKDAGRERNFMIRRKIK